MRRLISLLVAGSICCTMLIRIEAQQKQTQPKKSIALQSSASFDGKWTGKTEQNQNFSFTIVKGRITSITAGGRFSSDFCSSESTTTSEMNEPIVKQGFSIDSSAGGAGMSMKIAGRFISPIRASGTAKLTLHGGCSGSIDTKWIAAKGDIAPSEEIATPRKLVPGWLSLGGGDFGGGPVPFLTVNPQSPDIIYATTQWKLFKSSDAGKTFQAIGPDGGSAPCAVVIDGLDPSTVYAVGTEVFKSVNGGANWQSLGRPGLAKHVALVIDPADSNRLYLGGEHGWGIFLSTNGGLNWKNILASSFVCCLAIDQKRTQVLYAGILDYSGTQGGLLKSTDAGTSWTRIYSVKNLSCLVIDGLNPDILYAGIRGDGVIKTSDGGATWAFVNKGFTNLVVHAIAVDRRSPGTIYAGTDGGMFRSSDGGSSWIPMEMPDKDLSVLSIAIDPLHPGGLLIGTNSGAFRKR